VGVGRSIGLYWTDGTQFAANRAAKRNSLLTAGACLTTSGGRWFSARIAALSSSATGTIFQTVMSEHT
jgi:hypothetical protein